MQRRLPTVSNCVELTHELGQNFIEYAMAVNTDRSLPDAKTGLKPVHRRIIYDSFANGHTSAKVHVKCANVVGETMANYHPHGDSSIYGALVRLSQKWVMRYPLIDFHGNNGNIGGDPPAHYRYTECRLAKVSEDGLLEGIKKNVVDFMPNYSESMEEPSTLPSYFPNLLCNPNTGIGVAMACSWLPHNLREIESAIIDVVEGRTPSLPGPDFPTGGIVINKDDLPNILAAGRGTVRIRGQYKFEGNKIVFYEIPYGVTVEALMDEIGVAADEGKLEGVTNVRNESNRKGLRIVVDCAKDANIGRVLDALFRETNLQTSISYNQVALVNKEPKELGLKECIDIYLQHGIECIARETQFDKQKVEARLEIVSGLLKALEDIDNVIALIKKSDSAADAKRNLMEKYNFSEPQAKAIVDMKLGKLANLEKVELQNEFADLTKELEALNALLNSDELKQKELLNRLHAIVQKYGDDRRTELAQVAITPKEKEKVQIEPEDCVVIITGKHLIKRVPTKSFKTQKRNSAGVKNNGDITLFSEKTNTVDTLMIFSSKGKMYRISVNNIPEGTNVSAGVPLTTLVEFEPNEVPMAYTTLSRDTDKKFIFFATKNGIIKKVPLEEYDSLKRTGVVAIKFKDGDELASVTFINQEEMMLVTKKGMTIRFGTAEMPISSRIAQGVKGMNIGDDDYVIAALPIYNSADSLAIVSEDGLGKQVPLKEFTTQNRGGKGIACYKNNIAGAALVNTENNILVLGDKSSIVVSATDLPILGRVSLGNILLKNNAKIISISKI